MALVDQDLEVASRLVAVLRKHRFNYRNEKELQDGIEEVLKAEGFDHVRECPLGDAGIVDFMVGGFLAVEVKIKGSPTEVARQVLRYVARDEVKAVMLVTSRSALSVLPRSLMGKEVFMVELWRMFL